ncbi:hypothetical protein FOZ60_005533 [Perkinsus olseni]|uniref:Uncharacterized protein n=1 Tax=Perkinsus olseni TaxID=32597 RepID=A0A7J6PGI9_PEROL|nr:hypothetical protein FOZ60_005533 [Perkinsus olseni]
MSDPPTAEITAPKLEPSMPDVHVEVNNGLETTLPLAAGDEDTILYPAVAEGDESNTIEALRVQITALQDRIKWLEEGQRKSLELRAIDRGPTPCARCLRCRCRVEGAALEDEVGKQEAASDGNESRKRSPEIRDLEGRNRQQGRSFLYKFSRSSAGSYGGVDKQALSTAIVEANEALGKTLTYFSIFCDQNDIYFVLKYETPTRWKQLADTLRNKYGISTSVSCAVPRPGYRTCMYPVLFSYCLDLDPNPYLSPNHPHPSSLLGDGEKQGSTARRTPALDAGGLPALPPSRGAEEEGNVPEGDGAPTVKIPGEDNQSIIDESAGCVEGSPLDQVEQCLERGLHLSPPRSVGLREYRLWLCEILEKRERSS